MQRIELKVKISPLEPWADILVAQLAELGFDSFVTTEDGVEAYADASIGMPDQIIAQTLLVDELEGVVSSYSVDILPFKNWNEVWESDFEPVFVEDKVSILAPFHSPELARGLSIIIQPQMSFGTGHHQTTWMMVKALMELESIPSKLLDMGTGTGVLAIVAEKIGVSDILAVDIESWSVENTIENANRNGCSLIRAIEADIEGVDDNGFEVILANINKNVLKRHFESYHNLLARNGVLIISGFFESDVDELKKIAQEIDFRFKSIYTKETWAALKFKKNS
jgi:ribosomal protein L11 methyltransferase